MPRTAKSQLVNWTPDEPLPVREEELYCLYLMQGLSMERAMAEAGISRTRAMGNHIRARLTFLRQLWMERHQYELDDWLRQTIAIAETDVTDVVEWGREIDKQEHGVEQLDDGRWVYCGSDEEVNPTLLARMLRTTVSVKSSEALTKQQRAAIKKIKVHHDPISGVTDIELELYDRLKALQMLGQYTGALSKDERDRANAMRDILKEADPTRVNKTLKDMPSDKLEEMRRIAWAEEGKDEQAG